MQTQNVRFEGQISCGNVSYQPVQGIVVSKEYGNVNIAPDYAANYAIPFVRSTKITWSALPSDPVLAEGAQEISIMLAPETNGDVETIVFLGKLSINSINTEKWSKNSITPITYSLDVEFESRTKDDIFRTLLKRAIKESELE